MSSTPLANTKRTVADVAAAEEGRGSSKRAREGSVESLGRAALGREPTVVLMDTAGDAGQQGSTQVHLADMQYANVGSGGEIVRDVWCAKYPLISGDVATSVTFQAAHVAGHCLCLVLVFSFLSPTITTATTSSASNPFDFAKEYDVVNFIFLILGLRNFSITPITIFGRHRRVFLLTFTGVPLHPHVVPSAPAGLVKLASGIGMRIFSVAEQTYPFTVPLIIQTGVPPCPDIISEVRNILQNHPALRVADVVYRRVAGLAATVFTSDISLTITFEDPQSVNVETDGDKVVQEVFAGHWLRAGGRLEAELFVGVGEGYQFQVVPHRGCFLCGSMEHAVADCADSTVLKEGRIWLRMLAADFSEGSGGGPSNPPPPPPPPSGGGGGGGSGGKGKGKGKAAPANASSSGSANGSQSKQKKSKKPASGAAVKSGTPRRLHYISLRLGTANPTKTNYITSLHDLGTTKMDSPLPHYYTSYLPSLHVNRTTAHTKVRRFVFSYPLPSLRYDRTTAHTKVRRLVSPTFCYLLCDTAVRFAHTRSATYSGYRLYMLNAATAPTLNRVLARLRPIHYELTRSQGYTSTLRNIYITTRRVEFAGVSIITEEE
ncbi:hypothetical protein FA95DRAFT_1578558 [Auriscalpium vulgare]|uniref:Uncharacterized protein n=1 Tax=Auriscalpium vulgare TaxID=40419 RepID=A0ACB8R2K8_9AGAM|nr:hypothetical protein FA95DRAFT_1578558 [Auriscalpium vulgare]